MSKTPIQWTDESVNPIRFRNKETGKVGHFCEKISPGCKNCYSDKMQTGPYLSGLSFIAGNKDKGELVFEPKVLEQVIRRKKPTKYFWCDMTDMFGSWVPVEWIDRCFATMALTPWHTHQVLTKRADRMREYFQSFHTPAASGRAFNTCVWAAGLVSLERAVGREIERIPDGLPNVWLGVSVEDQQRADERIPLLLQAPAAVRFLSVEPLLGPVRLDRLAGDGDEDYLNALSGERGALCQHIVVKPTTGPKLDWVIVGGESGPNARPCNVAWIRAIVQQCKAAGVACFVKQIGAKPMGSLLPMLDPPQPMIVRDRKGGDPAEWSADLRVRETPERGAN